MKPSEMTNDELNEACAEARGWQQRTVIGLLGKPLDFWVGEGVLIGRGLYIPASNIAQAMELLREAFKQRREDEIVSYLMERAELTLAYHPSDLLLWWLSHPNQARLLAEAYLAAQAEEGQ